MYIPLQLVKSDSDSEKLRSGTARRSATSMQHKHADSETGAMRLGTATSMQHKHKSNDFQAMEAQRPLTARTSSTSHHRVDRGEEHVDGDVLRHVTAKSGMCMALAILAASLIHTYMHACIYA
jgi:hypothetical protein